MQLALSYKGKLCDSNLHGEYKLRQDLTFLEFLHHLKSHVLIWLKDFSPSDSSPSKK